MQKMRTQGNGVITPAKKERKSVREVTWVVNDYVDNVDDGDNDDAVMMSIQGNNKNMPERSPWSDGGQKESERGVWSVVRATMMRKSEADCPTYVTIFYGFANCDMTKTKVRNMKDYTNEI